MLFNMPFFIDKNLAFILVYLNIEKKKNETIKELLLLGIKYVKLLSQLPFSTIPIVGIFNLLKSFIVEYELFIVLE